MLIGPWKDIEKLRSDSRDLVIIKLPAELDEVLQVPGKAPHALACLALVVGLMVSGLVPNVQAALIGCLLMGVLGCIDLRQRLPFDRLENHRPDRRHAAVFNRA